VITTMTNKSKAMLSANLAASAAQIGKKVLLIEADAREPAFQGMGRLPNDVRGNEIAEEGANGNLAHYPLLPTLYVSSSDCRTGNTGSLALVDSEEMIHLVKRSRNDFDLVVIDAPSMLSLADARFLSELADVTIQVAERGTTTVTSLQRARKLLSDHAKGNLCVVLSGVDEQSSAYRSYYGYC
jgi:Mrp family chromosome partitioning ATPase